MDVGVEPPEAYNAIYGTKKITYMQMLGVVSSARTTDDEKIAWLRLTEEDLDQYDVDTEDTHGYQSLINSRQYQGCLYVQTRTPSEDIFAFGRRCRCRCHGAALGEVVTITSGQLLRKIGEVIKETIPKLK